MGEALGRFGRWVGLGGWRAGVLGPGRGSDPWLVSPPNPQRAGPVLAMRPQQAPVSGKVFIQRDYSSGTRCQFQTKFPAELENRVRRLASRTCSGARERGSSGMGGVWADPGPLSVSRLWGGAGKEGALVRRGPLSKTRCLEEDG